MKTGDRVVCIDAKVTDSNGEISYPLRLKGEYIIQDVNLCVCGQVSFDVGLNIPSDYTSTFCTCGKLTYGNTWFFRSTRFRKVEEKVNYVKLEIEVEEPCLN